MKITMLTTKDQWLEAFPIMKQLRTHLDKGSYISLISEAVEKDNYRLYALYDHQKMVAVVGLKPMITLYYGRFVWVCDLVTDNIYRSRGYGEYLLNFVHTWAADNKYESVALSSGIERYQAHRFYEEKMDYEKVSYVFKSK
ncbi:GNAT family N-acetyltransferase [Oceanobacillus iheyensis]|uniref:Hypothetical conserved protein n=1 Tax=Oceanobacillus iheyensis (strain DSM 14371 / CIP 107618 / JCM 11309 / KCTC 3954 / HTE831) TaxID=221109 RepID=Q8ETF0_OCEIH|nr:GNAT family N-acetyltransferase [Oceanobacillus iheyensis]BAC12267.1 hypothetical conserved protein [Oceanobacillus iheyensis HTE831]